MLAVATQLFVAHIVPGPLMCVTCQLLELTTQGLSLSSTHMQDTIEVLRSSLPWDLPLADDGRDLVEESLSFFAS